MRQASTLFSAVCIALLTVPLLAQGQASVQNAPREERPTRTWFVSPKGRDENPGTEQSPFRTVLCAVAKAQAHDTVVAATGIYPGGAQVNKPLSLIGTEGGKTVLQGRLVLIQA